MARRLVSDGRTNEGRACHNNAPRIRNRTKGIGTLVIGMNHDTTMEKKVKRYNTGFAFSLFCTFMVPFLFPPFTVLLTDSVAWFLQFYRMKLLDVVWSPATKPSTCYCPPQVDPDAVRRCGRWTGTRLFVDLWCHTIGCSVFLLERTPHSPVVNCVFATTFGDKRRKQRKQTETVQITKKQS